MKKAALLVFLAALAFGPAAVVCSQNCGIKPIAPIGCKDATCVCDEKGKCKWVWSCK